MRRRAAAAAVLSAALVLASDAVGGAVVLKCGTATQPGHIYNQGLAVFESRVEELTRGAVDVQVFPAAQLGSERDMIEGLQLGTLEMTLTSTGPLGSFVPQVKVFNLPFLIRDREAGYRMLDGPIGASITDRFPAVGFRSLGWFENGFRHITNSRRAIERPSDLEGIKIRVMEDEIFILTLRELGASPLPMAFGEVYTALEQKTIDAQENPLAVIHSSRLFEVQKHLALTGHFYSPALLLISEKAWGKLAPDHRQALSEAAARASAHERALSVKADRELEAELRKAGMAVTRPDTEAFARAVSAVYGNPSVIRSIGGGDPEAGRRLIERVRQALP